MSAQTDSTAIGWRKPAWIALLVAASIAFTLGFACATPLAAFAAVAALTMTRRDAVVLVGLVWLANQCVGFGVLHFPWTSECLAWGAALGAIAVLSVFAADFCARRLNGVTAFLISIAAFLAAFVVYEGLLFLGSAMVQSGVENYAPLVIGRIFAINAVAFAGLLALSRIGISAGLVGEPRPQLVASARRG